MRIHDIIDVHCLGGQGPTAVLGVMLQHTALCQFDKRDQPVEFLTVLYDTCLLAMV